MMEAPRFYVRSVPIMGAYEIRFGQKSPNGGIAIAEPVVMHYFSQEELDKGATLDAAPMMTLDYPHAQESLRSLMDELWRVGIRPSDIGTPGHLAATQFHLSDMRRMVEKAYSVNLVKPEIP